MLKKGILLSSLAISMFDRRALSDFVSCDIMGLFAFVSPFVGRAANTFFDNLDDRLVLSDSFTGFWVNA